MSSALGVIFVNYRCAPAIAERAARRIADGHTVVVVDNSGEYVGPGTIVDAGANVGFGPACNLGAAAMPDSVTHLCLHNPDLDISAAALAELTQRLSATSNPGAIVPALHTPSGVIESGYHEPQLAREVARAALAHRPKRLATSSTSPKAAPATNPTPRRRPPQTRGERFGSAALVVLCRRAFEAVGGFDERYVLYGEDLDLWHRLREAGFSMSFANDLVASHAQASGSPTSSSWRHVLRVVGVQLFLELHHPQSWRAFRRVHRSILGQESGPLHRLVLDAWARDEPPQTVSALVSAAFADGIMDRDETAADRTSAPLANAAQAGVEALVVTRNPDLTNLERLLQTLAEANVAAVVADNASPNHAQVARLCARFDTTVVHGAANVGLAQHLNRAVDTATSPWLLYLDQDSGITADQVCALVDASTQVANDVGQLSPQYRQLSTGELGYSEQTLARRTRTPIGSASVYRVAACREVGGFDPRLPLDLCDFNMALTLQGGGHRVVIEPSIVVDHQVGERAVSRFKRAAPGNHQPWRYYTQAAALRIVAARHWRTHPQWVARNIAGRIIETLRSAASLRQPAIIAEALRGLFLRPTDQVPDDLLRAVRPETPETGAKIAA